MDNQEIPAALDRINFTALWPYITVLIAIGLAILKVWSMSKKYATDDANKQAKIDSMHLKIENMHVEVTRLDKVHESIKQDIDTKIASIKAEFESSMKTLEHANDEELKEFESKFTRLIERNIDELKAAWHRSDAKLDELIKIIVLSTNKKD